MSCFRTKLGNGDNLSSTPIYIGIPNYFVNAILPRVHLIYIGIYIGVPDENYKTRAISALI